VRRHLRPSPERYTGEEGTALVLRSTLSAGTRREYARIAAGGDLGAAATADDAWQRAVEFLFARLVVSWEIHGLPLEGQRELLARFRAASAAERAWVRETLRRHCAQHFPDMRAP
jgi:hypothetical protein